MQGLPVHVSRLAGIYGPGRSALDAVRAGRAKRIDKPGQLSSRIPVDDTAATLEPSMARPTPGRLYNACHTAPAAAAVVTPYASKLLGAAAPPFSPLTSAVLAPLPIRSCTTHPLH